MKLQRKMACQLASACCLSLLIAWQASASEQLQQPNSLQQPGSIVTVTAPAAEVATAQDTAVTPAGCCDSGCDTCCGGGNGGCCGNGNNCCGNSCCEAICCPKKVTEEVKKHYWEVSTEMICIPGFRFECNWRKNSCGKGNGCCDSGCGCADACCSDSCCSNGCCKKNCEKCPCSDPGTPTCGRVRCIKVLEKHDYTCDECGYEWEAKCVRSGNGRSRCGKGGCCCPSCGCASVTADEAGVQLTSATETAPADEKTEERASLSRRLMSWLK